MNDNVKSIPCAAPLYHSTTLRKEQITNINMIVSALPYQWVGGGRKAFRTGWKIIPFLVTNVINYVIIANTMAIM